MWTGSIQNPHHYFNEVVTLIIHENINATLLQQRDRKNETSVTLQEQYGSMYGFQHC